MRDHEPDRRAEPRDPMRQRSGELDEPAWALQQDEERLRALLQDSTDFIMVHAVDGSVLYASPSAERVLGYSARELVGKSPIDLVHPDDRPRVRRIFRGVAHDRQPVARFDLRVRDADSKWVHLESIGRNLMSHPGVRGILVTSQDTTDRRALQEQCYRAQRMEGIGRLAGGVAHDLNNVLTALVGYIDLAQAIAQSDTELQTHLASARSAAQSATELVAQVLGYARTRAVAGEVVAVNTVVRETSVVLARIIGPDIAMLVRCGEGAGSARIGSGQLQQVIVNLAVNARDAMPDGGTLTIETRSETIRPMRRHDHDAVPPGAYAVLSVTDTGCGMDKSVLQRIFEPLYTTKEPGHGTGLGLSTCLGIVTQASGHIRVASEPGKGSTFKVYLPSVAAASEVASAPSHRTALRAKGETVLLAEDDAMVREYTTECLQSLGYHVLVAGDGEEAVRVASNHVGEIHLLLSDCNMPRLGGRELSERLLGERPLMKVLLASGEAGGSELDTPGHVEEWLQKPYSIVDLSTVLRKALGERVDSP